MYNLQTLSLNHLHLFRSEPNFGCLNTGVDEVIIITSLSVVLSYIVNVNLLQFVSSIVSKYIYNKTWTITVSS